MGSADKGDAGEGISNSKGRAKRLNKQSYQVKHGNKVLGNKGAKSVDGPSTKNTHFTRKGKAATVTHGADFMPHVSKRVEKVVTPSQRLANIHAKLDPARIGEYIKQAFLQKA